MIEDIILNKNESSISSQTYTIKVDVDKNQSTKFHDITETIQQLISKSKINSGIAVIFSKHTTSAIVIQENEPLLLQDLSNTLESFAPKKAKYKHNDFDIRTVHMHVDECTNGHSHCQHLVLGTSETIPIVENNLTLGNWQRIFHVELDQEGPASYREIILQILGT